MGCECLGPKKSQQQVYIKIIKQIHEQAKKVGQSQPNNTNLYASIMERLVKKGQLRKLSDNLSSRRDKIQDSMIFNYKLTQNKQSQTKQQALGHAGLIITDCITQVAYPRKPDPGFQPGTKSQNSMSLSLSKKQSTFKLQNSSSYNKGAKRRHHSYLNSKSPIPGVDGQYLIMILFLFENYGVYQQLRSRILGSVNNFCVRHSLVGVIDQQGDIWKIIEIVANDISKQREVQKCCQILKNLLICTKDQPSQHMKNPRIFQQILTLSLSPTTESTQQHIYQILQLYFRRFTSSWQSEFLYENIFIMFDRLQFEHASTSMLERLYEDLVADLDSCVGFQRALFGYLLSYLVIGGDGGRRWVMESLGVNFQHVKMLYKNYMKAPVKVEGFRRLNAWIDKKYINIDQFTLYNNKAIAHVYISNLSQFATDSQTHAEMLEQFKRTYSKLSPESRTKFLETCIDWYQDQQLMGKERQQIVNIVKEGVLMAGGKMGLDARYCFIVLDCQADWEYNMDMVAINHVLLNAVDIKWMNSPPSQDSNHRICQLLFSLPQTLSESLNLDSHPLIIPKYQLAQSELSYLQEASPKLSKTILLAYYQQICYSYISKCKIYDIPSRFCMLYYGAHVGKIVAGVTVPAGLDLLVRKVEGLGVLNQARVLAEVNAYFLNPDQLIYNPVLTTQFIKEAEFKQFQEYNRIFSGLFTMQKGKQIQSVLQRRQTLARQSSVAMYSQTSSNKEGDRSFQQAIDILKGR